MSALLTAEGLTKSFSRGGFWASGEKVQAVADVGFSIARGETLAIVGESGSGKSTTARLVMRLLEADAGRITLLGEDLTALSGRQLREKRRHLQMVFQDPFASLNPRMRIGRTVEEGVAIHFPELSTAQRRDRVAEVLGQCGLDAEVMGRYPHQFSGGQRQRIGIARALAVSPDLLVLDEPVSALDVSVQAQIITLLQTIQQQKGLAYLFISHDLSVVRQIADRVVVMFAGRVVETGQTDEIFNNPRHPYSKMLLASRPVDHPSQRRPLDLTPPVEREQICRTGCPFRLRCPVVTDGCAEFDNRLQNGVACLRPESDI